MSSITESSITSASAQDEDALASLRRFTYTTLLNEDTQTRTVTLLGTYSRSHDGKSDDVPALLKLERQNFSHASLDTFVKTLDKAKSLITNDIYHLFLAWSGKGEDVPPDLKLTLIQPATEVEIRKASKQIYKMVRETPKLYQTVVLPYLESFPPGRLGWVYNILEHKKESENIVYEDKDPLTGFIILPDLKWDQQNMSMLYLQCIVHNRHIRCLRDLIPQHLPMLKNIRKNAEAAAMEKYGVTKGDLRMFVHYQPSFYHFHVHIVHVSCHGYAGSTIGQAHLLDSIIDNLELEEADGLPASKPSYYARRTLTYGLGEQHGLYKQLWQATESS